MTDKCMLPGNPAGQQPEEQMQISAPYEPADQKALELQKDFSYDGYQVVRRELFAHLREPAVVIRRDSITFNTACIAGMEDTVYIQILVNPESRKMVVRKCGENDKDALRWCIAKPDKRKSRKVTSRIFSAKMYDMMGWSTDCRYKILGHKIVYEDEMIYIFDLEDTGIFLDIKRGRKGAGESVPAGDSGNHVQGQGNADIPAGGADLMDRQDAEVSKAAGRQNRRPFYPEEWKDCFGLPVEEHKKALEINIKDGYAEFMTASGHKD